MAPFLHTVDIQAPPGRVWDIVLDVERWREWTPTISSIERLDVGPFAVGSRFRVLQPQLRPAIWQVMQLDHFRRIFVWATRSIGVVVSAAHQVEETPSGSRATLSLRLSGLISPLAALLSRNINREYLATETASLKRRCER